MLENKTSSSRGKRMFCGTREKCIACGKTVYPIDKVILMHRLIVIIASLTLSCVAFTRTCDRLVVTFI